MAGAILDARGNVPAQTGVRVWEGVGWVSANATARRVPGCLEPRRTSWTWFARTRAEQFSREAGLVLPRATGQTSTRDWRVKSARDCALGRVWTFATPAWPEEPWEIALCQAWPSSRRVLGMRVQTFVTLLGENAWTRGAAAISSLATGQSNSGRWSLEQKLAKDFALPLKDVFQQLSKEKGASNAVRAAQKTRLEEYFAGSARDCGVVPSSETNS